MTSTLLSSSVLHAPTDATVRRTGAAGLVAALAAAAPRWLDLVEYRPSSRWTHLLPADDAADVLDPSLHADLAGAQVWLLSWLPDQGTPLHDHGTSAGAFTVVRGTLTERVVAAGRSDVHDSSSELTAGRVRHFGPHYVHQVTNAQAEPAISVHVYTPGLSWMNTYRIDGAALVRTGTERAGVDW
ncbi:cysteine dioxygenase family protein [Blastococcus sp. CT_GayMR16]|uniref:cysteine dioxygenase n=1 Tax=Blastococcus sp. CT_GayMR16 TaxID=2559607 RepID=UPI0010732750|nr:cysteine dioxygenase family protein [Blastococcus sp. CT_GayMR16]TFV88796.1 cysteine dioxygenase [Blastococcus sp. CT_GayMR16]